jgi:hypothetical protein
LKRTTVDPYAVLEFVELVQGVPPWHAYFLLELARLRSEVQSKSLCEVVKYKGTGYSTILRKLASQGWVEQVGHGKWRVTAKGLHLVESMNLLDDQVELEEEKISELSIAKKQNLTPLEKIILALFENEAFDSESALTLSSLDLELVKEKLAEGFLLGKVGSNRLFLKSPGGILMGRRLYSRIKEME